VCRKTLRSYRMRVCVSIILYVCVYEIRLIAREKRTTILYAILRPSSRIVAIIIIIIIIYNWTAAECSRRKEFSTRFCPIYTYTYKYTRVCARASTIPTVLHMHRYYIIYSRGPTFRGLRYFPYSQQMVFLFIFPVYVYIVRLLLLLSLYIVPPLTPSPSKVICHNVRRRVAAR